MRSTRANQLELAEFGDPIPEQFDSLEEAADFWANHSPVDYPEFFHPVRAKVVGGGITYELTLDAELDRQLPACAKKRGVNVPRLLKLWLEEKAAEELSRTGRQEALPDS